MQPTVNWRAALSAYSRRRQGLRSRSGLELLPERSVVLSQVLDCSLQLGNTRQRGFPELCSCRPVNRIVYFFEHCLPSKKPHAASLPGSRSPLYLPPASNHPVSNHPRALRPAHSLWRAGLPEAALPLQGGIRFSGFTFHQQARRTLNQASCS